MTAKEIITHINGIVIYRNFVTNLPYNSNLIKVTRQKRKAGRLSEVLFWKQVRNKNFHHIDFDRQRIIGNNIVDFYVKTLGLIIEIDGNDEEIDCQNEKQFFFENLGLKVFLTTDFDVKFNLAKVLQDLENFIIAHYS